MFDTSDTLVYTCRSGRGEEHLFIRLPCLLFTNLEEKIDMPCWNGESVRPSRGADEVISGLKIARGFCMESALLLLDYLSLLRKQIASIHELSEECERRGVEFRPDLSSVDDAVARIRHELGHCLVVLNASDDEYVARGKITD